jgi:hypothetical protein
LKQNETEQEPISDHGLNVIVKQLTLPTVELDLFRSNCRADTFNGRVEREAEEEEEEEVEEPRTMDRVNSERKCLKKKRRGKRRRMD